MKQDILNALLSSSSLGAILVLGSASAARENGQLAHAKPIEGIVIDGDLSDWPDDVRRYPIERAYYDNEPKDGLDFHATLRLGYDAEALYVAIEVVDSSHVVGHFQRPFESLDACLLYVDLDHDPRGSGPVPYVVTGNRRELAGQRGAWDPKVAAASWDGAEAVVKRSGHTTTYEFMVLSEEELGSRRSIGLDVVCVDMDEGDALDDASWVAWGPFTGKSWRSARCGDVVLVGDGETLGTLRGTSRWAAEVGEPPTYLGRVRVTSKADPRLWVQALADENGDYAVELPAGEYTITSPFPIFGEELGPHYVLADDVRASGRVRAGETSVAGELVLRTAAPPDLYREKGVLFDFDASRADEIDAFIEAWRRYYRIPGLSVALVRDRELVYHRTFGVKNAYTGEPVGEDTLFEACSITKIVFAFAVNRMAERGEIDLDRPLHEYLAFPDAAHDERYQRITARHVLSHRTGFPNWRPDRNSDRLDLLFDPGTKFGYSGEGFEYLGKVVAHLKQQRLEDVLLEETLRPMGFAYNTYFASGPTLDRVAAHGHDTERPYVAVPPSAIGVAHSMHTEAKAFSNFMISLLEEKGLSKESYEKMYRFETERPPLESETGVPWERGFGLGFSLMRTPFGTSIGHGGSNGDFHCLFEAYPEHGLGFIAFGNNERAWAFTEVLRRFLIAGRQEL